MNRFFGRLTKTITKPWQMYPIGMLFGLGFDTATEVALLFLAGGARRAGLPFYAILCLPILFAAGMSLMDTIDGSFMNFAYGWAFSKPVRKVFYNLTITGLSVAVALVIGTIELGGLIAQQLNSQGAFWSWFENININTLGFIIVGMFVATGRSRCWSGASAGSRSDGARSCATARHRSDDLGPQTPTPVVSPSVDDAAAALRDAGSACQRPGGWCSRRCSTRRPGVGGADRAAVGPRLASVYRNLETLERNGLVRHVHLGHGPGLYALLDEAEREYLYCDRCGAVRPLPAEDLDPVRDRVRELFGYDVRFTHFPIVGTCPACAGNRTE